MSRIIKFRAWDKEKKLMIEVGEMAWLVGGLHIGDAGYSSGFVKNNYILMQFTGLHDKHGKPVYKDELLLVDGHRTVKVIWHEPSASFDTEYIKDTDFMKNFMPLKNTAWCYRCEIIGSIHQSPEVLKKEE